MKKKAMLAAGLVAAAGTAVAAIEIIRGRKLHEQLLMCRKTKLSPEAVIGAGVHVEREPEIIPFVRCVEIIEEEPNMVRYKVRGSTLGMPWWIRYRKSWDYDRSVVKWSSECASFGLRNTGRLEIHPDSTVYLQTAYSVDIAGVGGIIEKAIRPFVTYAFERWIKHITGT